MRLFVLGGIDERLFIKTFEYLGGVHMLGDVTCADSIHVVTENTDMHRSFVGLVVNAINQ